MEKHRITEVMVLSHAWEPRKVVGFRNPVAQDGRRNRGGEPARTQRRTGVSVGVVSGPAAKSKGEPGVGLQGEPPSVKTQSYAM